MPWDSGPQSPGREITKCVLVVTSDESKIIFLQERSTICQYRPESSTIIGKKSNEENVCFWPTLCCTF